LRHVKGILLKPILKAIRANKNGVYDELLSEKDREIISQKILTSLWYPFEVYKNGFNAILHVKANGNCELIRQASRKEGEIVMNSIDKSAFIKGDLKRSLEAFVRLFKLMFDFSCIEVKELSNNHTILEYIDFDTDFEVFFYAARDWTERFLELVVDEGKKLNQNLLENRRNRTLLPQ
jgi:hypothetical protein